MSLKLILISMILSAPWAARYPTTRNAFIENDSKLYEIECDKTNMIINIINNVQMCYCRDGYYLKIGNIRVMDMACAHCKNCSYDKDLPYQVQACGHYANTLCCTDPRMTAHMTEYGYLDCVWPAPPEIKESTIVLPTTSANEKSTIPLDELVSRLPETTDCNKPNMIRHTRNDGRQVCYCGSGYHLQLGNIHDLETARCRRCTDCKELPQTPHQTQVCGKYFDTLCCASPDMEAQSEEGYPVCFLPDTSPSSPPPTTTLTSPGVTDGVIGCDSEDMTGDTDIDGKQLCICRDGRPAEKKGWQFICRQDTTNELNERRLSNIMTGVIIALAVLVLTALLVVIIWCWGVPVAQRLSGKYSCSSKEKRLEAEDQDSPLSSMLEMRQTGRGYGKDITFIK